MTSKWIEEDAVEDSAPVVLFTYNRPIHTSKTLEALSKNRIACETDLIVYSDGPKELDSKESINQTRHVVLSFAKYFKSIETINRETNFGLARNITEGVTEVLKKYESVIVLEDDLITSPLFLSYMNQALAKFRNDDRIVSIHGYTPPVQKDLPEAFFLKGADCWGWATWRRGWQHFEFDGSLLLNQIISRNLEYDFNFQNGIMFTDMLRDQILGRNNSWAVRWHASAYLKGLLTLHPGKTFVQNIGFDGTGTHCAEAELPIGAMIESIPNLNIDIEISNYSYNIYCEYYQSTNKGLLKRLLQKIKKTLLKKSKYLLKSNVQGAVNPS